MQPSHSHALPCAQFPAARPAAAVYSFGIQMNENVLQQLENAEFKWKGLKKKMLNSREQLTSLQQYEVCVCVCVCARACVCVCVLLCCPVGNCLCVLSCGWVYLCVCP